MPVPKMNVALYKISDNEKLLDSLEIALHHCGFLDCENPRVMVKIIEENNLDKSQFDFPYGSFEEFKKHVLNGEYDDDFVINFMTKDDVNDMIKSIEDGRSCI